MKIVVNEIDPQDCPFYIGKSWGNSLHIEYEEENCKLDTEPWEGELQRWSCHAKKGDKECPFCITYDEFKRRMEKIKEEK